MYSEKTGSLGISVDDMQNGKHSLKGSKNEIWPSAKHALLSSNKKQISDLNIINLKLKMFFARYKMFSAILEI